MINYKPTKYKELKGEFQAIITSVEVEENRFYDPLKENSTENVLTLVFELIDPISLDPLEFTQKFVAPLTGGKGLFQKLMDIKGELPDMDGGSFDEQKFVGMRLVVTFDKNKKGYDTITDVKPATIGNVKESAPIIEEGPTDLPFD